MNVSGQPGGSLGYDGIPNSLVVELDTFNNGSGYGDPNGNHVAVHSRGTAANGPGPAGDSLLGAAALTPFMQDGAIHQGRIAYDPSGQLRVYVDDLATPALTVAVDLSTLLSLDADKAFVGFTSATGAAYENHDVLDWSFCPAEDATNLDVTQLDAPASARNGHAFDVEWQVTNQGSQAAAPSWVDKVYLSADETLDVPGDTELSTKTRGTALAAGSSYTESANVSLSGIAAGPYFLILKTDDGATVAESNESDNLEIRALNVLADLDVDAGPDWKWRQGRELVFDITVNGSSGAHTCNWNFGDGMTSGASCQFVHTYAAPGTYTATVSVTDGDVAAGDDEVQIEVLPPEGPGEGGGGTGRGIVVPGTDVVYTLDDEFEDGTLLNVNHDRRPRPAPAEQRPRRPFPFVNVAARDAAPSSGSTSRPARSSASTRRRRTTARATPRARRSTAGATSGSRTATRRASWTTSRRARSHGSAIVLGGTRADADGTPNPTGQYLKRLRLHHLRRPQRGRPHSGRRMRSATSCPGRTPTASTTTAAWRPRSTSASSTSPASRAQTHGPWQSTPQRRLDRRLRTTRITRRSTVRPATASPAPRSTSAAAATAV